jgi:DNA-binding NarL/FixJ family response regulator
MDIRQRLRRAAQRHEQAKAERDETIVEAAKEGLSRREIAGEVDLTYGRVQQIIQQKSAANAES